LGIVLHVLLSGTYPFLNQDKNITKKNIIAGKLNLTRSSWNSVAKTAKDLVSRVLQPDPDLRFSIVDILKHPWL